MGQSQPQSESSGFSVGFVIILILFIIFLILAIVFIWLYVNQTNQTAQLQATIDNKSNCPPNPMTPCPTTNYEIFATTGSKELISCPNSSTIQNAEVLLKTSNGRTFDIANTLNLNGKTTYIIDPEYISRDYRSGFDVIYGSWTCSANQVPIPPKSTETDNKYSHRQQDCGEDLLRSMSSEPCEVKKKYRYH